MMCRIPYDFRSSRLIIQAETQSQRSSTTEDSLAPLADNEVGGTRHSDDDLTDTSIVSLPRFSAISSVLHLVGLVLSFLIYTGCLLIILKWAPPLEGSDRIHFPTNLHDLRDLADTLKHYKDLHLRYTLILFCSAYVYKQSYAIPGCILLNLLSGALFGMVWGTALVAVLTAIGASCCFMLSDLFCGPLIQCCLEEKMRMIKKKVSRNRRHIFLFLLSARVFPFTPHWLLNISSPFVGIPLYVHFFTIFIGMIPYHAITIRAGMVLSEITSVSDIFDVYTVLEFAALTTLLIVAGLISKKYQTMQEEQEEQLTNESEVV